ncbi:hypothetical protein [Streptoalloteichus hindustanus]|uniref:hypothetical protein n=1 Tax=Streptoalloteichus hindustanus TaxID=2017 RepID=UPI0011611EB4|nr:hypothetical protein [Streptoalloteichus hindustanus]
MAELPLREVLRGGWDYLCDRLRADEPPSLHVARPGSADVAMTAEEHRFPLRVACGAGAGSTRAFVKYYRDDSEVVRDEEYWGGIYLVRQVDQQLRPGEAAGA